MAGRIILSLSCLLCAGAFFLLAHICRISTSPVQFQTGSEKQLKAAVKDVPGYNRAMRTAFRRHGLAWLTDSILGAILPPAGVLGLGLLCTLGLYLLYRCYRSALHNCT